MVLVYQSIGSQEAFVKERYWLTKRSVTGPGFPAPITLPSIFTTGTNSAAGGLQGALPDRSRARLGVGTSMTMPAGVLP